MCKIKKFDTSGNEDGHTFDAVETLARTLLPSTAAPDTVLYVCMSKVGGLQIGLLSLGN